MMFPGRVAAVSYLNTVPFIYGLEHADFPRAALLLSPPNRCVTSFVNREADIALIPAAALAGIPNAEIITSYCIGASGPVRTVAVMSNTPIDKVKRVFLDAHSRTSVVLTKILCDELWHLSPQWVDMDDYSIVEKAQEGDAFLLIGDKVFDYEGRFGYTYDLAEGWIELTKMPFVFAIWVSRPQIDQKVIADLNASLEYGVSHISEAINYYGYSGRQYAYNYLTKNIDYIFDEQKRKALSLFWEKGQKFIPLMNPG